ncbi:MAG: hypothetical protein LW808_000855 [Verrucomicrobiota bacterium]|nr:MAG: hypothetical protein LW808_000855 [Verrucomicrobiota bacterium]
MSLFVQVIVYMYIMLYPPIAAVILLGMSKSNTVGERLAAARKVCCIAGLLLFTFAFFGNLILDSIFHISTEAFQVAGGLLLLTSGLSMLLSKPADTETEEAAPAGKLEACIVTPLATPLLVGPGTIAATIVKIANLPEGLSCRLTFYLALATTLVLVYLTFYFACKFSKYLTPALLGGFEKIAGFIVASLAASLLLAGASGFYKSLSTKVHEQNTSDLYGESVVQMVLIESDNAHLG